ncbi:MAG: DinB family protein [Saprospiraceae bacterium]|nr:DinB family protein [Saprospiraceae bacterium]MCB9321482.1 DinB family protein [Lewinellaceae bacterium]
MNEFENLSDLHREYTYRLQNTLESIPSELIVITPESGWSFYQIFDHIVQVESRIFGFITSGKKQEPKLNWETRRLHKAMTNRSYKVSSPEPFLPKSRESWSELYEKWQSMRSQLEHRISVGSIYFDDEEMLHPILGSLTRMDWFYVFYFHGERHRLQMEELMERLASA